MAACKMAEVKPGLIFVMDPNDEPLATMIRNQAQIYGVDVVVGEINEEDREDKRNWNSFRFEKMVDLRNTLLQGVRFLHPPLFLSLDSDILLHSEAIKSMIANLDGFDAIGGKAYMTHTGTSHPSYGMIGYQNSMRRIESEQVMKVDVIMAIKLMTPKAYNVDYEFSSHGEDIGWSTSCTRQGLTLRWDGSVTNKHVMRPKDLQAFDKRVGF